MNSWYLMATLLTPSPSPTWMANAFNICYIIQNLLDYSTRFTCNTNVWWIVYGSRIMQLLFGRFITTAYIHCTNDKFDFNNHHFWMILHFWCAKNVKLSYSSLLSNEYSINSNIFVIQSVFYALWKSADEIRKSKSTANRYLLQNNF